MNYGILRIEKIKASSGGEVLGRLKHSLGENRYHKDAWKNEYSSTSAEAFEAYKERIKDAKKRSDSVGLFEIVITRTAPKIGEEDYFDSYEKQKFINNSAGWVKHVFGLDNIVAYACHRDEKVEHLHFFVTPLQFDEKTQKMKLNAKNWTGGKMKLKELQTSAYRDIFMPLGLERGEDAEKTKRVHQRPTLEHEAEEIAEQKKTLSDARERLSERAEELGRVQVQLEQKRASWSCEEATVESLLKKYDKASPNEQREMFRKTLEFGRGLQRLLSEPAEKIISMAEKAKSMGHSLWTLIKAKVIQIPEPKVPRDIQTLRPSEKNSSRNMKRHWDSWER